MNIEFVLENVLNCLSTITLYKKSHVNKRLKTIFIYEINRRNHSPRNIKNLKLTFSSLKNFTKYSKNKKNYFFSTSKNSWMRKPRHPDDRYLI